MQIRFPHTCKRCRRWLALVTVLLLVAFHAPAQQIYFNKIVPGSGKNFEHITGMVQDQQGYIWLATKNGLFRYDGYQMVQYKNNPLEKTSIGSDFLETICIDKQGNLWIGTFSNGLDKLDPATGVFTHYRHDPSNPSSISNDSIFSLLVDKEGTLWVGTQGLNRFNPTTGSFTHYQYDPHNTSSISDDEIRSIYEDRQGTLWIGTGSLYGPKGQDLSIGGLNRMNKKTGTFQRFKHDPNNPHSLAGNKVRAMFEDSKGNFWVGTNGDGLHIMNRTAGTFQRFPYDPKHPEKLSRPPLKKAPFYDHITFITEDTRGAMWIGTAESGINYYDPKVGKVRHFESGRDSAGSFQDYTAWWAIQSREGVLWISTIHGSLYRINPLEGSIPFYPVPSNGVYAMFEDRDKTIWISNGRKGLLHQEKSGKLIKAYLHDPNDPTSVSGDELSQIRRDSSGNLWVGSFDDGLNRLNEDAGTFTHFKSDSTGLSNNTIFSIYDDPGPYFWIGTFDGISRMDQRNAAWRNYFFNPRSKDDSRNMVTSILKDSHNVWWAACWKKEGVKRFDPETGKAKSYLAGASLIVLFEDHAGVIWAAGLEGLYRYKREQDVFEKFEDALFLNETNVIMNLLEDNAGSLWMTTSAGIVRLNRERNETTLFGKSYGVRGNDFFSMSGMKDSEGKLYFGYQSGYYSFFPDELARGIRAPEIVISSFKVANQLILPGPNSILKEPLSSASTIRLRYDQDVFSFEFAGIDYSNPEDNRHLFMLENYDEGWHVAGAERTATYFNVPPGKYIFRVKVVNSYGVWSARNITVIITPPWWTTWWFRLGVLLLIIGSFYLVVRWQVRQKFNRRLERSEQDKQLAELRQKTGELEMQALRVQMNPHFVFNSLNAINRFILQNNRTQASEYLTKFSRLIRMILQNSQSPLITLESELESLKLYLELEALRFDYRFEYKVTVPKDVDVEILKVPPLIIQPYAENAIWHGLMHKEEKGNLSIDIRQEGNFLYFTIKDDGVGRAQSAAMTSKSATKHKSMGLTITADRISHMQRALAIDNPVVINDLTDKDGNAAGTEVIIKIPVVYD